ncbi:MAG TPA: UDP-N-acetylmuramoyl-L-alanine--D-glutamate ligase [Clostridiaceae bacterium]|nr:UDP-N-acetylmuramoyl-L-alanine--D-glutamate ligase [Clostridiaceae bacterium]
MKDYAERDFRAWVKDKKIAVVGAGISNRPLISWLYQMNKDITVFDQMGDDNERLQIIKAEFVEAGLDLRWSTGDNYLDRLTGFDLVFRTPIMRPDHPALSKAAAEGAIITSEMSIFLSLCPAHVTGITGSDGKTTTTTLIGELYKAAGKKVWVGGNIGTPLLDKISLIEAEDEVVVELSSFQLFDLVPYVDTAVITNIFPNHLDIHTSYEEYILTKKNIFKAQSPFDRLVLNYADAKLRSFADQSRGEIVWFNKQDDYRGLKIWCQDPYIWKQRGRGALDPLLKTDDIVLPGRFNVDNYMAAWAAVDGRIPAAHLYEVATMFKGVPHRLELIRVHKDVRWYNSSIDSTPTRTVNTLRTLAEQGRPIILICGGRDKDLDYSEVGRTIAETVSHLIFCGENASLIKSAVKASGDAVDLPMYDASTYQEAVKYAASIAEAGSSVLLSPTGTSFDQFFNFEERGDAFRNLVLEL